MIHVTLSFAVSSSEPYADLSPPRQPLLQVVPVKQEPWIVVISGIFMASFYTGSALDADSLIFPYIIRTDRSHGTDLCTKTAVVAVVRHQRFHLTDINRLSIRTLGLKISRRRTSSRYLYMALKLTFSDLFRRFACKLTSHFQILAIGPSRRQSTGEGMFPTKAAAAPHKNP